MSDRSYRFILGLSILISLFIELDYIIYLIIIVMLIESITNYRIPLLINQFKTVSQMEEINASKHTSRISIDAERVFRFIVASFIALGYVFYPDALWFFPWFVGLNLILAGITGICPMVMLLHKIGFR